MVEQAKLMKQNLLSFCRHNKTVYCYGAGVWADILRIFLENNDISISAYYVSDSQSLPYSTQWDTPIRHANELKGEEGYGLILGLGENYQKDILFSLNTNKKNIFAISEILIKEIMNEYRDIIRSRQIQDMLFFNMPDVVPVEGQFDTYENRIQEFMDKYKKIEILFANSGTVGILQMELICWKKYYQKEDDTFYLLQTTQVKNPYINSYTEPNEYIIRRFKGHNFTTLSLQDLPFWKYFAKKYSTFFEWNSKYNLDRLIETCVRELHLRTYFDKKRAFISFSKDEEVKGQQALETMGVEGNFVCVFNRDGGYYKKKLDGFSQRRQIMDYYRSSRIDDFRKATDFLQTERIMSIRVGSIVEEPSDFASLIEYARLYHDDFMDVYLAKKCLFFLGDSSGVNFFYSLFSKPMVITNYPLITTHYEGVYPHDIERDLILYHKFWDKNKQRYLNLSEILEIEEYCLDKPFVASGSVRIWEEYYRRGIVPISNTKEEIRQAAKEMIEKIRGTVQYSGQDEELQAKFWNILYPYIQRNKKVIWCNARVARYFLRENLWLTQ